jgi:hypothetical protein
MCVGICCSKTSKSRIKKRGAIYMRLLEKKSTNQPAQARVVGYALFSLCVIHKEGLCPSSGEISLVMEKKENKKKLLALVCVFMFQ